MLFRSTESKSAADAIDLFVRANAIKNTNFGLTAEAGDLAAADLDCNVVACKPGNQAATVPTTNGKGEYVDAANGKCVACPAGKTLRGTAPTPDAKTGKSNKDDATVAGTNGLILGGYSLAGFTASQSLTTGYLLLYLAHHPEAFDGHTHLVVDEVRMGAYRGMYHPDRKSVV